MSAKDLQQYFEQLCEMDEQEFQELWENSEVCSKLRELADRLEPAQWVPDRDTIKCSKCGFGFFPSKPWFQDGVCVRMNDFDFRPNYCPNCGKKMKLEGKV